MRNGKKVKCLVTGFTSGNTRMVMEKRNAEGPNNSPRHGIKHKEGN
jgi:hypothetical protein